MGNYDRLCFDTGGFSISGLRACGDDNAGMESEVLMKKAVKNYVVLLWASVYLLAWILVAAVREIRDDIRQVIGEVSLIRSILFLCFGVCAIGYAGVVIALFSR